MSYSHRKKIQIDSGSQVVVNSCYESMSFTVVLHWVLHSHKFLKKNDYALFGLFRKVARGENPWQFSSCL